VLCVLRDANGARITRIRVPSIDIQEAWDVVARDYPNADTTGCTMDVVYPTDPGGCTVEGPCPDYPNCTCFD